MKWKKRQKEIARLRKKHGRSRSVNSLPNLKTTGPSYPSLSDGFAPIVDKQIHHEQPEGLIVDTLHKQGPMVLSRGELPWAGGKKP